MMKKPKAHWDAKRRKWGAKGINPDSGARRTYFAATESEASNIALESFGASQREGDTDTLYGYYAQIYLPTILGRSENWQSQVGWAMDGYIIPTFGAQSLTSINRADVQRHFNRLVGKVASSSLQKIKIVFSGVMNLAADDEVITKNPVSRVRIPRVEPITEKKALTFAELAALIDAAPEFLLPPLILMACSLNLGEACAARRIHVRSGEVQVRRQILQPAGGAQDIARLKTPQRKRDIPLPNWVIDRILSSGQVSSIWVSSNSTGGYLLPNNVQRELEKIVGTETVPRITPHELRHTFISLMENELECPQAIVAALSGKKHRRTSTAGYSHTEKQQQRKWMNTFWEKVAAHSKRLVAPTAEQASTQSVADVCPQTA